MNKFNRLLLALALAAAPVVVQAQTSTTPRAGANAVVVTGGTAVNALTGPSNGAYICNPYSATDEGIMTAEPLYVDPTKAATTTGSGTNAALQPGQCWGVPPYSTLPVSVNAATSAHAFVVVRW